MRCYICDKVVPKGQRGGGTCQQDRNDLASPGDPDLTSCCGAADVV